MSPLPLSLSIACEASKDSRAIQHLVDRVLASQVDWFDGGMRAWRGEAQEQDWWPLRRAREHARSLGLRNYGHFGDRPAEAEAHMYRAQLLVWKHQHDQSRLDAVFIVRDLDSKPERELGVTQAIASSSWPFVVVVGLPQPEMEAWQLAGFVAGTPHEEDLLETIRARLGFCPCSQPERTISTHDPSPRDAKRVLNELTCGDSQRQWDCLCAEIEVLRTQGSRCWLAVFIRQVERDVVPLLSGYPSSAQSKV